MEYFLENTAETVALSLEAISILVIALGGIEALYRVLWPRLAGDARDGSRRGAWLSLARWLVLGLEFMLAADIVRTVIQPSWMAVGQLAATAVIRTFLNFFLERDLEAASKKQENS